MTAMDGNPHHDVASQQIDNAAQEVSANWSTKTGEYKSDMLAAAQIEATLALAFEQRTANLIALYSMDETNAQGMVDGADVTSEDWVYVTRQIAERLGLLEPVTIRENTLRGESIPAMNVLVTHCPYGHEYDAINTYVNKTGGRHCRTCQARRSVEKRMNAHAARKVSQ